MKRISPLLNAPPLVVLAVVLGCAETDSSPADEEPVVQYNEILQTSFMPQYSDTVLTRELQFPSGWEAPRHFHSADLFIYVLEGEFEVTMDGDERRTYGVGQALEMRSGATMVARNPSSTASLKLVVFQVGSPGAPFVVPVE
jgi:quercetin dioxygenase-like cupin family protein